MEKEEIILALETIGKNCSDNECKHCMFYKIKNDCCLLKETTPSEWVKELKEYEKEKIWERSDLKGFLIRNSSTREFSISEDK